MDIDLAPPIDASHLWRPNRGPQLRAYDPGRPHRRRCLRSFQVDDLADLAARMQDSGIDLRSGVRELAELDYLMVEAPDGVLLEVFEYKGSPNGDENGLDAWFS